MSQRAQALADQLERTLESFAAAAEQYSEAHWRAQCKDEGWTVGVTVHHVAENCPLLVDMTRAFAEGQPLPADAPAMADRFNAEHAQRYAECGIEETIAYLRQNSRAAADFVRTLTDEQLDRTAAIPFFDGAVWTVEQWITNILIGHAAMHIPSIEAAV